jgi:hypothetical protein
MCEVFRPDESELTITLPSYHCEADEVSRSNLVGARRLPRTFQVLAITNRKE